MLRSHVLVVVAVDIAGSGHVLLCNRRVPRLQIIWQAARRFGNDLKAARHGIDRARVGHECLVVEAGGELNGKTDVVRNVTQRG